MAAPLVRADMANDDFKDKTKAPNELWQTDFTCLKVLGLSRFP